MAVDRILRPREPLQDSLDFRTLVHELGGMFGWTVISVFLEHCHGPIEMFDSFAAGTAKTL